MKMKKILSLLISLTMVMSSAAVSYAEDVIDTESESGLEEVSSVATVNGTGYASFDTAMTAANDLTAEEVTIELYGKVEYTDATENLVGTYKKINFVGKTEDAEISITRNGSNGYIAGNANGTPDVTFTDLILSKPAGAFASDAGFMNVAFSVYRAGTVVYTNCYFANGACASGASTSYTNCTFKRSNDKYGLWAYGAEILVDGCTFDDYRGIKMYAEGQAKTTALTVKNSDFSAVSDKPAIVLTYGESVVLEGNTYSSTGVFELDKDGAPNGTAVTADITDIACMNDTYADCGVLVNGKIYTTVSDALAVAEAGDTIVLMYDTEEVTELPEGVVLDKNGHTADNIKTAGPKGSNSPAYTKEVDGYVRVWGEGQADAKESYVLKLYSNEKLIATTNLNNIGGIIDGDVNVTWNFIYPASNDEYWTTTWEKDQPNSKDIPTKVELWVDGVLVDTTDAKMSGADNLNPVKWRELGGVAIADIEGEGTAENPYLIGSLEELKWFRDDVNAGNNYSKKVVKLADNIDLVNEEWTPIGNSTNKFQGTFDCDGKTISNLVITGNNSYVGLFGYTTNGEIKNLTLNNAKVSGYLGVGAVAGCPYTSKYTNINLTGHVEINGMAYVGGVGGRNAYADWTDITVDVDETSYVYANSVEDGTAYRTYVGGVIGFIGEGGHKLTNISSNINVTGSSRDVGGITGIAHYSNIFKNINCSGDVKIENATSLKGAKEIGGIAGVWHNQTNTKVTFEDCQFTGEISSSYTNENGEKTTLTTNDFVNGGLIGAAYNSPSDTTGEMVIDYAAYIGNTLFETLTEATAAAEEMIQAGEANVTVGLMKSIAVSNRDESIEPGCDNIIYDLNGNILSMGGDHVYTKNTTFKNGSIKITDEQAGTGVFWLWNHNNTVTFEDVNFSNAGESINACGIFTAAPDSVGVTPTEDTGDFVFINCKINLYNNTFNPDEGGNLFYFQNNTSNVKIEDSTINVQKLARGLQYGTYDIDNSSIIMTDMYGNGIRRAAGTITDSTVTLTNCENGIKLDSAQELKVDGDSVVTVSGSSEYDLVVKETSKLIKAPTATINVTTVYEDSEITEEAPQYGTFNTDVYYISYAPQTDAEYGTYYQLIMMGGIDSLDYEEVGFYVTPEGGNSKYCGSTKAFSAINVTKSTGEIETLKPERFDENAKYIFYYSLGVPEMYDNKNITITPYAINYDGEELRAESVILEDIYIVTPKTTEG